MPCTRAHQAEVVGVAPVPAALAGEERTQLLTDPALATAADPTCRRAVARASGLDAVRVPGAADAGAGLPDGVATLHGDLTSAAAWDAGTRRLVCAVHFRAPVTSPDSRPLVAHLLTSAYPAGLRACDLFRGKQAVDAPCSKAHSDEFVFTLDGRALLPAAQAAAVTRGGWDYAYQPRAVRGCARAFASLRPDKAHAYFVGALFPEPRGPQLPLTVRCYVSNVDGRQTLPAGSVFDQG